MKTNHIDEESREDEKEFYIENPFASWGDQDRSSYVQADQFRASLEQMSHLLSGKNESQKDLALKFFEESPFKLPISKSNYGIITKVGEIYYSHGQYSFSSFSSPHSFNVDEMIRRDIKKERVEAIRDLIKYVREQYGELSSGDMLLIGKIAKSNFDELLSYFCIPVKTLIEEEESGIIREYMPPIGSYFVKLSKFEPVLVELNKYGFGNISPTEKTFGKL